MAKQSPKNIRDFMSERLTPQIVVEQFKGTWLDRAGVSTTYRRHGEGTWLDRAGVSTTYRRHGSHRCRSVVHTWDDEPEMSVVKLVSGDGTKGSLFIHRQARLETHDAHDAAVKWLMEVSS